jgi:5-methylcytosine-specific restriction endonuclease McrA
MPVRRGSFFSPQPPTIFVANMTKKQRLNTVRQIIDRNKIEIPFCDDDLALFNEMCGSAFEAARRMVNPSWLDTRHIHVLVNGQWQEFSWVKAINGRPKRPLHVVLRKSIMGRMQKYRKKHRASPCAACWASGDDIEMTVDHVNPTFSEIAEAFIAQEKQIDIIDGPAGYGKKVADPAQEARWLQFHDERAVYQLLCRSCNSSKGQRRA